MDEKLNEIPGYFPDEVKLEYDIRNDHFYLRFRERDLVHVYALREEHLRILKERVDRLLKLYDRR